MRPDMASSVSFVPWVVIPGYDHGHALTAAVDGVQVAALPRLLSVDVSGAFCPAVLRGPAAREGGDLLRRDTT